MAFATFSVELDKDIRFLMKLSIHTYLLHRNRIKLHPPVDFGGRICEKNFFGKQVTILFCRCIGIT